MAFRQLVTVSATAAAAPAYGLPLPRQPGSLSKAAAAVTSAAASTTSQVYYTAGFVLHFVVPRLFAVKSVQQRKPRPGQVAQEALHSIGAPLACHFEWAHIAIAAMSAARCPCLLGESPAGKHRVSVDASAGLSTASALVGTHSTAPAHPLQARCWSRRGCGRWWRSCTAGAAPNCTTAGRPPQSRQATRCVHAPTHCPPCFLRVQHGLCLSAAPAGF